MSSTNTTSGRRDAEISSARRIAQNVSSAENVSSIRPIAAPTRCVDVLVLGEQGRELHPGRLQTVVGADTGGRADDLADRPVRDAFAVGEASTLAAWWRGARRVRGTP